MTLFSSSSQYRCQRSQYVSTCPHLRNLCSNNLNLSPFILSNSRATCYAQPVAPQHSLVRFHPPPAVFLFSPPSLCSPPLMRSQALGVKEGHSATATDKDRVKLSFDQMSCAVKLDQGSTYNTSLWDSLYQTFRHSASNSELCSGPGVFDLT